LFALQTAENQTTRQASFAADKAQSDDEVIWDDDDEDDDDGSSVAPEGSGATHDEDGSEELEEQGESLSHSSKSPCPSSLREWSEDDDDELDPSATLGAITLHVATAAATGGKISSVVDVPDSPERLPAAPKPATSKKPGGGTAAPKKRAQPAPPELAQKQKRTKPAVKDLLPPRRRRWSSARLQRWLRKILAFILLSTSCSHVSDTLDVGHLSCRASISIDRFLKPFPTTMPEGTEPSASTLSRSKRMRRGTMVATRVAPRRRTTPRRRGPARSRKTWWDLPARR
jgi:hypothetical protein